MKNIVIIPCIPILEYNQLNDPDDKLLSIIIINFSLFVTPQIDWGIETVSATNADTDNVDWGEEGEDASQGIDWGGEVSGEAIDWGEGVQTSTEEAVIDWGDDGNADIVATIESCGITLEESGQGKDPCYFVNMVGWFLWQRNHIFGFDST